MDCGGAHSFVHRDRNLFHANIFISLLDDSFHSFGNLAGWYYSAPPVRLSQRGFGELCYTAHQFITGIDPNGVTIG